MGSSGHDRGEGEEVGGAGKELNRPPAGREEGVGAAAAAAAAAIAGDGRATWRARNDARVSADQEIDAIDVDDFVGGEG